MTHSLLSPALAEGLMTEVVTVAMNHVTDGGIPFSASVVTPDGTILGSGVNTVMADHDPTAHAEVCAIRHACANKGLTNLSGRVLLASGEPCAMCYVAALFAGVSEVIYAVSATEAAQYGYGYGSSYGLLAGFPEQFPLRRRQLSVPGALRPFNR